jgi:preprotein translocase subunit SecF
MPKQSHRTAAKKKAKKKYRASSRQRQPQVPSVQESLQTSAKAIPPIGPSRKQSQRSIENPHVAGELKKIGIMAGAVFAILIALWVVLPNILG